MSIYLHYSTNNGKNIYPYPLTHNIIYKWYMNMIKGINNTNSSIIHYCLHYYGMKNGLENEECLYNNDLWNNLLSEI